MPANTCSACTFGIDQGDNFCRRCGLALEESAPLPVARGSTSLTIWRPQASPVVKGAAVMAAGTLGQFVVRRAISSLLGEGPRKKRRSLFPSRRRDDGLVDEAQIITETVMMRRVRIRRPA
jgi:hypothetical protein